MTVRDGEVRALARRWGQPLLIEKQIVVAPGLQEEVIQSFFADRWGEVVMVIRRAVDGRVWVMTKPSFPRGLYSLPTGGIRHREAISAALRRELDEETGFEVRLRRFVAAIHYVPALAPGDPQQVPGFFSYVFLLEEEGGNNPVVTGGERILDFGTVAPEELLELATQWRELSGASSEFHDLRAWGCARSIIHQVAADALVGGEKQGDGRRI